VHVRGELACFGDPRDEALDRLALGTRRQNERALVWFRGAVVPDRLIDHEVSTGAPHCSLEVLDGVEQTHEIFGRFILGHVHTQGAEPSDDFVADASRRFVGRAHRLASASDETARTSIPHEHFFIVSTVHNGVLVSTGADVFDLFEHRVACRGLPYSEGCMERSASPTRAPHSHTTAPPAGRATPSDRKSFRA
jgi:hypothetical protein